MVQIITNSNGGGGVGLYKYKGSVDYYEDLPTSGMKVGDTYNVVNAFTKDGKDYPAGTNVAWTGTDWDALGGSIDLSDYQKKLVEGEGIDIDQDTNEISVDTTVIATKQDLTTKQDVISDLDTIRSNASAGKSAKDTIDTYGDIVTHNVSEFATAAQGALADTALQPNDNVSELVNDAGYLVSSDLKQSDWGQSDSSAIDYIKNKPTIGNATLTIQRNGTQVNTFTANATSNVTANISVPTKTSDITNDSGYITNSVNDLTNYTLSSALATVATTGSYTDLSNKPAIPTDTSDLTNGAGFITGITSGDVTGALGYTPYNSTNPSGYVTSSIINDTAYGSGWNADTTHAPTKNAVYDKISAMDTTISGKQSQHSTITVTLEAASWSSNIQTVTATGVTASNTVIVSPAPASFTDYGTAQIYASAQASNSLTFTAATEPTSNITVNVVILN